MVISSLSELLLGNRKLLPSPLIHTFLLTVRYNPSVSGGQKSSSFKSYKWLMELYFSDHFTSVRKSKGSEKLFCSCHIVERKSTGSKGHKEVNTHQIPDWAPLGDSVSECISVFSSTSPHLLSLFGSAS